VSDDGGAFDRGVVAGEIAQRLRDHDQHLNKINGSMDRVADELAGIRLQMQRMADAMAADRATVTVTAQAVEKERESTALAVEKQRLTRRDQAERRWSPFARFAVAVGAVAAVAAIAAFLLTVTHT
jgi:hypothetical protein